jgi:Undecaprenyl-phosphate glucose phosphotransferase
MIRENQIILNRIQVLLDIVILILSLIGAFFLRFIFYTEGWHMELTSYIQTLVVLIPLYLFLYYIFGLYEPKRRKSLSTDALSIIKTNILSIVVLMSILFVIKEIHYSRSVFIIFFILNSALTLAQRVVITIVLRRIRSKGFNIKYILIIGAGSLGRTFAKKIRSNPQLGYSIIGYLDDNIYPGKTVEGFEVIGKIDELPKILDEQQLDEVIISLSVKEYDKLKFIIRNCEKSGVRTQIIPDYFRYVPARPLIDEIDGMPLINTRYVPLDNIVSALSKRLFDIVVSGIGLIICIPLFILIAAAIKIESPGPVFFSQERVGLNRKKFKMIKFRSMKVQAEPESDTRWTKKDDPRKTKVGTFIRRTSLDELPQLFNVLKGDMSLVGPRPERPHFVEQFREKIPKYMIKHHVRPGITGWAQVNGWRGDTSIRKRIDHDIYYIENWTFGFDLKILVLTVFKGLINKNAY